MPTFAMPIISINQIFTVLGLVLQYSLLLFIYYFIYRMVRFGYRDLAGTPFAMKRKSVMAAGVSAKLRVIETGHEILPESDYVIADSIRIGRNSTNTIILTNSFVSYEHAVIERRKTDYILSDLNSTNGTFVNGDKIQGDYTLGQGDEIKIGIVTFRFER